MIFGIISLGLRKNEKIDAHQRIVKLILSGCQVAENTCWDRAAVLSLLLLAKNNAGNAKGRVGTHPRTTAQILQAQRVGEP